ncbi:MAG: hypothetical protein LBM08_05505 [Dysgonamonadaceae bacterium]|jgi:tetratricopeptide (TPR) repeat protein|nr:hypothetical protein [Dysgonamonadaceae bacterium]
MSPQGKIRRKIKFLKAGLVHGQTSLTNLELGLLYQQVKEYDKAEVSFKKVIDAMPSNIYPRFLLMRLYEANGEQAKLNALAKELMQTGDTKVSTALKLEFQKIIFENLENTTSNLQEESLANAG